MRVIVYIAAYLSLGVSVFGQDRAPVPGDTEQNRSRKTIAEVFRKDYEAARNDEQKAALAKKMLDEAMATKNDPAGRYVLLDIASNMAADAGDLKTSMQAVTKLSDEYLVDSLRIKGSALSRLVKATRVPKAQQDIFRAIHQAAIEALLGDRFDIARPLSELALASARSARDAKLLRDARTLVDETLSAEEQFASVKEAIAILDSDPTNASANLRVGKYRCFVKGEWERGVSMLALGEHEALRRLAITELAEDVNLLDAGDGWWSLSESLKGYERTAARHRAASWYRKALPTLTGLNKSKVEGRLNELPASGKTTPFSLQAQEPRWISKNALYRISSIHNPPLASLLSEAEESHHAGLRFQTKSERGAHITIDLRQTMAVTEIYIQNLPDRKHQQLAADLTIWLSDSPRERGTMVWSAKDVREEWSVLLADAPRTRYITIGLPERVSRNLHLRKVKVFGYE